MEDFKILNEENHLVAGVEIDEYRVYSAGVYADFIKEYFNTPRVFKVGGPSRFSIKRITVKPINFLPRGINELPVAIFEKFGEKVHIEKG